MTKSSIYNWSISTQITQNIYLQTLNILKLFQDHCCNLMESSDIPRRSHCLFPWDADWGWWQWWGGWPNVFASNVFCSFFFAREEERDLLRERRVRFYFPLSVSGPTMNTKCWQNTNTTNANTQTHRKLKHKWNDVHENTKQLWKDSFLFSLKYKFLT